MDFRTSEPLIAAACKISPSFDQTIKNDGSSQSKSSQRVVTCPVRILQHFNPSRRTLLKAAGAGAALAAAGAFPTRLFAADPIKVAAIYTVPVEQQWVSRIHKAANAAKERGDIEYVVLRERLQHRL